MNIRQLMHKVGVSLVNDVNVDGAENVSFWLELYETFRRFRVFMS